MSQLAGPILKGQGVNVDDGLKPTLVDFNATSTARLAEADPRLSGFMTEVEKRANSQGINMQIAEAKRTADRQADLVAAGISPTMNSKHLTGNAADIYLVGPDGKPNYNIADYQPVADIAKEVAAEQGLTDFQWGGDWKSKDAVHFQLGGAPNVNTTVSTMGAPEAAAGGALPQTVESILSSLYPTAAEDEKAAHRKDIWRGLSQGLSALSQGNPVDLSNIAANADTRRRQYVLDTREKEKAKAAASLVYSQTGDASMAAGIASGAINYTDVLNERQMKRAEQTAQDARLKDAATTDALVSAMKAGKMPQETIDLVQKGGVDALSAYQKIQADQSLLEQEAKQQDIRDQNVADARFILSTAAPGSPEARSAERVIALGGEEDVYTLLKDRAPPAGAAIPDQLEYARALVAGGKYSDEATALQALLAKGGDGAGGTANMQDANALVDSGTINAATNKPYTLAEAMAATVLAPRGTALPSVIIRPDGTVSVGPSDGAPAVGGAPAAGGAGITDLGTTAPGTVTATTSTGELINAPIPGAQQPAQAAADLAATIADTNATTAAAAAAAAAAPVELQNAKADLAAQLQENRQKAATETDEVAKAALDVDAATIANSQAALDLQIAQASQEPDLELKRLAIEKAKADAEAAKQAVVDTKKIADDKAAQRQVQATVSGDTVMRYGKDILDMTSGWSDSVLAGGVNMVAGMIPRSQVSEVTDRVNTIKSLTALDSLTAMRNASPTGAAVGNPSDAEGKRLEARYGALNVSGDPTKLREDIYAAMNAYLDTVYGTPEQIRQRYNDGKITGAIADAYSARYLTRGAGMDPTTAKVGAIKTLGLTDTDLTVLGSVSGTDTLMDPSTLTAEEQAILDSLTAPAGGN
jgi:peptidoglycan L-alanyl-D-glutamate endopeptidase CwlK